MISEIEERILEYASFVEYSEHRRKNICAKVLLDIGELREALPGG